MKFMFIHRLLKPAEFLPVIEDHLLAIHPILSPVSMEIEVLETSASEDATPALHFIKA